MCKMLHIITLQMNTPVKIPAGFSCTSTVPKVVDELLELISIRYDTATQAENRIFRSLNDIVVRWHGGGAASGIAATQLIES